MFARKRNNKELMQLFGELGIISFVRIGRLNWLVMLKEWIVKKEKQVTYITIIQW